MNVQGKGNFEKDGRRTEVVGDKVELFRLAVNVQVIIARSLSGTAVAELLTLRTPDCKRGASPPPPRQWVGQIE